MISVINYTVVVVLVQLFFGHSFKVNLLYFIIISAW